MNSICPSLYSLSTHWEATKSDVMPFKFPSKPRSCQQGYTENQKKKRNRKFTNQSVTQQKVEVFVGFYLFIDNR